MLLFAFLACAPEPAATGDAVATDDTATPAPEPPKCAVVTDIDGTITTSDDEFFAQMDDPSYDPAMRPDADALFAGFAALGYRVVYVTGRGERMELADGTSARDATVAWLDAHGFPLDDGDLFLADTRRGLTAEQTREYKAGVVTELQGAGFPVAYAYTNTDTDVLAFQDAGLGADAIFLVGELAGTIDVGAIPDEEAYTAHVGAFLPGVTACGDD